MVVGDAAGKQQVVGKKQKTTNLKKSLDEKGEGNELGHYMKNNHHAVAAEATGDRSTSNSGDVENLLKNLITPPYP